MTKAETDNGQTTIYKAQHKHAKAGGELRCSRRNAVPAPLIAPVVFPLNGIQYITCVLLFVLIITFCTFLFLELLYNTIFC